MEHGAPGSEVRVLRGEGDERPEVYFLIQGPVDGSRSGYPVHQKIMFP